MRFILALLVSIPLLAGKVKIEQSTGAEDTSITIRKGAPAIEQCVEFQILEGSDEIAGEPEYDRTKAKESWKRACDEWKASMKDLNKENSIIHLSCKSPTMERDGDRHTYKSNGSYKVKVRVKDKVK